MKPTGPKHLEAALQEYASLFDDHGLSLDGKKYLVIDKGNDHFQVVEKMGFFQSLISLFFGNAPYTKEEANKYTLADKLSNLNRAGTSQKETVKAISILLKKLNVTHTGSTSPKIASSPKSDERPNTPSSTASTKSISSQQRETFEAQLKDRFPNTYKDLVKTNEELKLPSMDDRETLSNILDEIDHLKDAGKKEEAKTLRIELTNYLQNREDFGKGPSYK